MDKERVVEKLGEVFGDNTVRVVMPKRFLADLKELLTKQNEDLLKQIKANNISPDLIIENKKTQEILIELKKAIQENRVERVEITNLPEYPKFPEIKIPEQKEIKIPEYPTKINLIEPEWYQKGWDRLLDLVGEGFRFIKKSFAEDLDSHMAKDKALAVRLVDTEGKTFYNAVFPGGSGGTTIDISALATELTLAALLTELQLKADLTETQPVSLASVPSHPVTNAGTFAVQDTSTAATPYHLVSAASTNATSVKASAGVIYGIYASNVNAAVRYLKLYNKASAPTVGTDTPVHTFAIPGNTAGAGTNIPISERGINFTTGIAFALTTEATDAGATGVAVSEIVVNLDYI